MSHWGYVVEQLIGVDEQAVRRERRRRRRPEPVVGVASYEITCARAAGLRRVAA